MPPPSWPGRTEDRLKPMPSLLVLAVPFAMALSVVGSQAGTDASGTSAILESPASLGESPSRDERRAQLPRGPHYPASNLSPAPLDAFWGEQSVQQVRIERRVIVRISPRTPPDRNELLAQLPQREVATRFEEREMDKCLAVDRIAGVQTGSGNRLLLFMRDAGIVSVNLEKACRARDFYSGFYVEQSADGKLCAERDKLQSRSGVTCEVERMMRLVATRE